jgi:hypothetical protein
MILFGEKMLVKLALFENAKKYTKNRKISEPFAKSKNLSFRLKLSLSA